VALNPKFDQSSLQGNTNFGFATLAANALEMPFCPSHNGTGKEQDGPPRTMPTLFRLLVTIGILVGIAYAAMFALVTYVEPKKGEMTVRIPVEKLNKQQ
jgi:hypothetical protein